MCLRGCVRVGAAARDRRLSQSAQAALGGACSDHERGASVPYPVTFEADYAERRNRLTTFFRLIMAIPLAIVLYVYAIVAAVAVLIAWFAIVFTARYPRG